MSSGIRHLGAPTVPPWSLLVGAPPRFLDGRDGEQDANQTSAGLLATLAGDLRERGDPTVE